MSKCQAISAIKIILYTGIIICSAIALICFASEITQCIIKSIELCLTVIVPSLYGFLVLSGFFVKSGLYRYVSAPFGLISRYVLKIPAELFSVFLISQIGGYPVGTKLLADLRAENKLSDGDASALMCYCYNSGPAFIIGTVGINLFSSVKIGCIMFLAIFTANLITSVIIGSFRKAPPKSAIKKQLDFSFEILIDSINRGAKSLFRICVMIVFFSIVIGILEASGIIGHFSNAVSRLCGSDFQTIEAIIKSAIEISHITEFRVGMYSMLPVLTGLISFGGICVLIQAVAIAKNNFSVRKFLLLRPLTAILSSVVMLLYMKCFSVQIMTSSVGIVRSAICEISPIPSVFLLIMTILLLSKKNIAKF